MDSVLWMSENLESQPDVAFLRVNRVSRGTPMPPPIPLSASASPGEIAITIGYPARDPDVPDQELVRQVFGDVYDKKRLAPGEILKVTDSEIEHDCSTLGGNSGSAVVSLATGEALGLHFAGLYMEANYAVPAPKLRDLLSKLQSRSLPGMRAIEVSSHAAPIPAAATTTTTPSTGGGRTFTLEAYVPIKVTLEVGGAVSMVQQGAALPASPAPSTPATDIYQAALQTARDQLRGQPGVLDIRLGYRFRRGWITNERVIVVEVQKKQSLPELRTSGKQLMPAEILGIGVDVRTAALVEQLAAHVSLARLEAPSRPGVYREPPHLQLEPVNERMQAIFHVSPDWDFRILKQFMERIQDRLTATIYEWEPNHISDELFRVIKADDRKLTMVVERRGTLEAVNKLERKLGAKFDHVWASTGAGKIVPSAYHIKVACRDGHLTDAVMRLPGCRSPSSPRSAAMRSAAGSSWRWPPICGWSPRTRCSGCRRSLWVSSGGGRHATAAAVDRREPGQGADLLRAAGLRRRGPGDGPGHLRGSAGAGAARSAADRADTGRRGDGGAGGGQTGH